MDLSIVIVNWNTKKLLLDCLASVFETVNNISMEVWLVDNASSDGSVEAARKTYPSVQIIQNQKNLGFAAANNQAFKKIQGRYALLLNTDTVLTEGAVETIYNFMEQHPDVGIACGQLLNQDGSKQNSFANFPSLASLIFGEALLQLLFPKKYPSKLKVHASPMEVDSCIGACMMVRTEAIEEIGRLDENFFFFFEETDWAFRMKQAGWKVYIVPSARIFHLQGQSVGHNIQSRVLYYRSRYIYFKKWHQDIYGLIRGIIFMRLLINAALNLIGFVGTFGLHAGIRNKLDTYAKLIAWHLEGFPDYR
ncbi:glycosyltransferase family 2 protein [Thermodesulfobacteriota bacterium]